MLTRKKMQALLDRMARAYSTSDPAGCAALFAEDARLHSPFAPPAIGRAAIEALHREWTAEPSDKSFRLVDMGIDTHLAWCLCDFADGAETGTSLLVLAREADDTWLIKSCCLYGDPA